QLYCESCGVLFRCSRGHPDLHSFPTRRSSDLLALAVPAWLRGNRPHPASDAPAVGGSVPTGTFALHAEPADAVIYQDDRRIGLRSEEHTSELQSQSNLVCRLLLEKKKTTIQSH